MTFVAGQQGVRRRFSPPNGRNKFWTVPALQWRRFGLVCERCVVALALLDSFATTSDCDLLPRRTGPFATVWRFGSRYVVEVGGQWLGDAPQATLRGALEVRGDDVELFSLSAVRARAAAQSESSSAH